MHEAHFGIISTECCESTGLLLMHNLHVFDALGPKFTVQVCPVHGVDSLHLKVRDVVTH